MHEIKMHSLHFIIPPPFYSFCFIVGPHLELEMLGPPHSPRSFKMKKNVYYIRSIHKSLSIRPLCAPERGWPHDDVSLTSYPRKRIGGREWPDRSVRESWAHWIAPLIWRGWSCFSWILGIASPNCLGNWMEWSCSYSLVNRLGNWPSLVDSW